MAESRCLHPTSGRRRREKGPPSAHSIVQIPLPRLERAGDTESEHSEDSAGEKEAKRQRSEPTTPVSTSSRHPYDYDDLMGITRVGTKEAEGFEEDLDSVECHDATEEPGKREEIDGTQATLKSAGFQRGFGSSSLKECIQLLHATVCNSPAPLDSGVGQTTDPPQKWRVWDASSEFARNFLAKLPGICSELGIRSEFARKMAWTSHARNSPDSCSESWDNNTRLHLVTPCSL